MNDGLGPLRREYGSAAGGIPAVLLWALFGQLGHTHAALAARVALLVAAAAATILLWRRLEAPGETLRWTLATFIAATLLGAADAAVFAWRWW